MGDDISHAICTAHVISKLRLQVRKAAETNRYTYNINLFDFTISLFGFTVSLVQSIDLD